MKRRQYLAGCLASAFWEGAATVGVASTAQNTDAPLPQVPVFAGMQISSGDNGPPVDLARKDRANILLALHRGEDPLAVARGSSLASAQTRHVLADLMKWGAVQRDSKDRLMPTIPVITDNDALAAFKPDPLITDTIASVVAAELPAVSGALHELVGFKAATVNQTSLLLGSDLLLDSWEIDNVEHSFLRQPRPARPGGHYYYALFQQSRSSSLDTFGIYGNTVKRVGNTYICVYGNARYRGASNLLNLSISDLKNFGFNARASVADAQSILASALIARWRNVRAPIPNAQEAGLRAWGLLTLNGATAIPIIGVEESKEMAKIANDFLPKLLGILERFLKSMQQQFSQSTYAYEGLSFAEWFIWYYHFVYSAVTDKLVSKGLIILPPSRVVTYLDICGC